MATNIDERIVAAKFDASDFEKGVDKTIKKLDELKKELNLKDATKGVKELAEKTEASTDSMSKSLDKLTERFTTFAGMIKQKILSGLADEVAGVFLKMEQSVKSFVKSISVDQIGAGLQKYQSTLTSVRQMVNAGYDQETVYKSLDRLRTYTDETSYSFEQMADAMSKMVAAGVDIDQATKNVEGIANACANAGINATEAQRAFFNLSQAFTKGKLEYTDYRSLELLNMTNEEFTKACMEAAVAAETLTKSTNKLGETVYKTSNKRDKKVKGGKVVNLKNFTDSLKYDFMNTEAMNALFGSSYWMEIIDKEEIRKLREELGDEEFEKRFGKIATKAYQAAYEARSFLDVINAIKDAASSNWATTFEYLFGKLDEAKRFFTGLAEGELADVVYKLGEYRNAVLGVWNDATNGFESGGGELFRQTIENITEALGTLFKTILDILPGFKEFDETDGEMNSNIESLGDKLYIVTLKIRDFSLRLKEGAERFREFMNSPVMENGPTRIELIRETLTNLGSVLSIFARVASIAFNTVVKALNVLNPIFDGFLVLLSKITSPLTNLKNDAKVFKDIEYSIDNIFTVLNPVAEVLGKIIGFLGEVGAFFAQMAIDTVTSNIEFFADAIGLVFELFTNNSAQMKDGEGVLARIQADFEGIKTACQAGLNALKEFFGALLGDIRRLLGLTDEAEKKSGDQNGGIFSGLINFFNTNQFVQDAKAWVNKAIVDVSKFIKSIPERVMKLGGNIYDTIRGLFFKDETKYNGSMLETRTVLTPLGEWLNQAIIDIKAFVVSIPQRIIDGVGTITNWIDEVFNYWFTPQKADNTEKKNGGTAVSVEDEFSSRFKEFIYTAKASIAEWFEDLPNKIRRLFANIGNFATNLYNAIDEFLFGKKATYKTVTVDKDGNKHFKTVTTRYKQGFSKWLDGFIKEIKKFIANIPEYIKQGIKGVGDIITTITNAIFGKKDGDQETTGKDIEDKLEKPFLNINLSTILTKIKEIGKEILNQIARIFTGSEDINYNMNWFSEKVAEGITWIKTKAEEVLPNVLEFIGSLPTTIADLFSGEGSGTGEQKKGPIGTAIEGFGKTIGSFIANIPDTILTFVDNAIVEFGKIWDKVYNAIVGTSGKKVLELQKDVRGSTADNLHGALESPLEEIKDVEPTGWEKFVGHLGQTISNIWQELPIWIANGIEIAIGAINDLIANFDTWFQGIGIANAVADAAEQEGKDSIQAMAEGTEDAKDKEEPRLITAIKGIGEQIKTLFVQSLPLFIQDAWKALTGLGTLIFNGFSSIFSGENMPDEQKEASVDGVGNTISGSFISELPAKISAAWAEIKKKASDVFEGFASIFTGEEPKGEIQKGVNKFGTSIYKFITEEVPKFIRNAFNYVKRLFSKTDVMEEIELNKNIQGRLHGPLAIIDDKLKEDSEKQEGSWTFVDTIKESLLNAFNSIGPALLNGLASALEWIGNIATIIIDALAGKTSIGEEVEKAYGKEKPELRTALNRVGEALKNFFLDTIPKFIGTAIGTLQKQAPLWFAKLFGSMSEAAKEAGQEEVDAITGADKEAKDVEKAVTGAMGVMDIIKTIINSIKDFVGENKDIMEIAVILISLTMIFNALSDLFSIGSMADSLAEPIKWAAIIVAITTIGSLLSYIGNLINENDPQKIEEFENILDRLQSVFKTLAVIMIAMNVGSIVKAIRDIKTEAGGGGAVGLMSDLFGGLVGGAATGLGSYLAGVGISAAIDTFTQTLTDAFTNLSSGVQTSLDMLDPTISKMEGLYSKLDTAIRSVEKIKELFTVFIKAFESLYEDAIGPMSENVYYATYITKDDAGNKIGEGDNKALLSMEAYMEILEQRLGLFSGLAVFINELSGAFEKIGKVDNIEQSIDELNRLVTGGSDGFGGKLADLFINIINMFKSVIESSHLSSELIGAQYTARTTGMITALDMLADTFTIFGTGIANINGDSITNLSEAFKLFAELAGTFEGAEAITDKSSILKIFTGDNSLSKVSSEIKQFGLNMKYFFSYVKDTQGFEDKDIDLTKRITQGMLYVLSNIATIAKNVTDYSSGFMLNDMNKYLPNFGLSVGTFFTNLYNNMPKDLSADKFSQLNSTVQGVSLIMSAASDIARLAMDFTDKDISEMFDKIWLGLGGTDQNKVSETTNKLSAIFIVFNQAIQKALLSEDYSDLGSTLAERLISGIQSAIDADPELRITPILNLDTAENQLKTLFGVDDVGSINFGSLADSARGANTYTDEERFKNSVIGPKIDAVTKAVNDLRDVQTSVDDLTKAFSQVKMYINKNVLVGEITDDIDYRIGLKIDLVNNGIST